MKKRVRTLEFAFINILVGIFLFIPDLSFSQRPPVPPINLSYFRVDFVQAGARSAALGGAFIAGVELLVRPKTRFLAKRFGLIQSQGRPCPFQFRNGFSLKQPY